MQLESRAEQMPWRQLKAYLLSQREVSHADRPVEQNGGAAECEVVVNSIGTPRIGANETIEIEGLAVAVPGYRGRRRGLRAQRGFEACRRQPVQNVGPERSAFTGPIDVDIEVGVFNTPEAHQGEPASRTDVPSNLRLQVGE